MRGTFLFIFRKIQAAQESKQSAEKCFTWHLMLAIRTFIIIRYGAFLVQTESDNYKINFRGFSKACKERTFSTAKKLLHEESHHFCKRSSSRPQLFLVIFEIRFRCLRKIASTKNVSIFVFRFQFGWFTVKFFLILISVLSIKLSIFVDFERRLHNVARTTDRAEKKGKKKIKCRSENNLWSTPSAMLVYQFY